MKLLILGHARHGKDTVAEILRDDFGMRFFSSSLFVAEAVCRPWMQEKYGVSYSSLEECYADRVNHRSKWYDAIVDYNREDPTRMSREILKVSDIYCGMRSNREYQTVKSGFYDELWWVDASGRGLPPEPKNSMDIEFDPAVMRYIDNNGSLDGLHLRVTEAINDYRRSHIKLVIVESPYAGDVEANVEYARQAVRHSITNGEAPIASHLLYTQPGILNDNVPEERRLGIDAGLAWRAVAKEAAFYVDRGWSLGMLAARELYDREGFPYSIRSLEVSDAA